MGGTQLRDGVDFLRQEPVMLGKDAMKAMMYSCGGQMAPSIRKELNPQKTETMPSPSCRNRDWHRNPLGTQ